MLPAVFVIQYPAGTCSKVINKYSCMTVQILEVPQLSNQKRTLAHEPWNGYENYNITQLRNFS